MEEEKKEKKKRTYKKKTNTKKTVKKEIVKEEPVIEVEEKHEVKEEKHVAEKKNDDKFAAVEVIIVMISSLVLGLVLGAFITNKGNRATNYSGDVNRITDYIQKYFLNQLIVIFHL